MNINSLSNGFGFTAANSSTPRQPLPAEQDDPLSHLTESDWVLVSYAVGYRVDPRGKLFPLLAFQIGWDRQSGALHRGQVVSSGYLRLVAARYSRTGSNGANEDLVAQTTAAIRYLESISAPAGLDISA